MWFFTVLARSHPSGQAKKFCFKGYYADADILLENMSAICPIIVTLVVLHDTIACKFLYYKNMFNILIEICIVKLLRCMLVSLYNDVISKMMVINPTSYYI
jgi:hypothetical protein